MDANRLRHRIHRASAQLAATFTKNFEKIPLRYSLIGMTGNPGVFDGGPRQVGGAANEGKAGTPSFARRTRMRLQRNF
ncbi:MAG: hypothetical protein ACI83P_001252 [Janthinobacterium sp.]|jgi:hypothetical protein